MKRQGRKETEIRKGVGGMGRRERGGGGGGGGKERTRS